MTTTPRFTLRYDHHHDEFVVPLGDVVGLLRRAGFSVTIAGDLHDGGTVDIDPQRDLMDAVGLFTGGTA